MSLRSISPRILCLVAAFCLTPTIRAVTPVKKRVASKPAAAASKRTTAVSRNSTRLVAATSRARVTHAVTRRYRYYNPWTEPTYADSSAGDFIDGEDLVVRRAAFNALGALNGSVVVADPATGRILTIVNQKLALRSGFQPCSTIKIVAALAGLSEGVIGRSNSYRVSSGWGLTLTDALAHSNNPYFARLGESLGFERVSYYARLFGLGEKAGLDIPGEQPGVLPASIPSEGLGMMTSFGSGISLTPLELTALMSAIANGGTLHYLQYPLSQKDIDNFTPRVKRRLDIARWLPDIRPGMSGAVEFGTARRASWVSNQPMLGKTGTCTDSKSPVHLGWFGSYNDVGKNRVVVVVLLTGGFGVSGSAASGVAGAVYKNLDDANYFQMDHSTSPITLITNQPCCKIKTE